MELSLIYPEAMATSPAALKVGCRLEGAGEKVSLTDSKPFGGDNLRGGDKDLLTPCLEYFEGALAQGEWVEPPVFEEIEPGLWLAVARARFGPRLGARDVVMVKADMARFWLSPYHEGEKESWTGFPSTVKGWTKRLPRAALIFNAGLYYPDRLHMGALWRDGTELPGRLHADWKGFVVQGPLDGAEDGPGWAIIDEDTRPEGSPAPSGFATMVQSHMVLDRLGRIRVRDTSRLASRSALAIDQGGLLWLVAVPGAISLYDLALLLGKLGLVSAVGLDGGLETQVALVAPDGPRFWLGSAYNNFLGNFLVEDMTPSLPAVIALERRPAEAAGPPVPQTP
jgi:hypothetical protein